MSASRDQVDGTRSTLVRPADAAAAYADPAETTRRPADDVETTTPTAGPERLDRYVLLGELGRGGMGVVHAAYDTTLDRKVALKLLRDVGGAASHPRMLREARALARLSHPNVVGIYEVGELGERVFLAMELVEGVNLRTWLADRTRTQSDILAVFLQAADGMTAAHAAGLVHRDFKPDNVVIGADGRVRVMDFGLARRSLETPAPRDEQAITRPMDPQLTAAGTLLGTPAYMAPEQHMGVVVGPAADIYSFAVTLYEALHGQRPFQGTTTQELAYGVLRAERSHKPEPGRVPAWLQAVIDRGLALEPVDRWPTMAALSLALRGDPTRRRRLLAAIAVTAVAAATWFGVVHHRESTQIAACIAEGASIDETWNDTVATKLRTDLLATDIAYAATTVDRIIPLYKARAEAWREAQTDACLDAHVHHTWNADTYDRATACLDDQRAQMAAHLDVLSRPDNAALDQAVSTVTGLASIAECRDAESLRRAPPLPADRPALHAARALLVRTDALRLAGLHAESLTAAQEAVAAAGRLGWTPLIADAGVAHGLVLLEAGANAEAEVTLERAHFQAVASGAPRIAADAADALVFVVGNELSRHSDGLRWVQHAEAILIAAGEPETGPHRLAALESRAGLQLLTGDYPAAQSTFERVLAGKLARLGPGHPELVHIYTTLASIQRHLGHVGESRSLYEHALANAEVTLGPDHPEYANCLDGFAALLIESEELTLAITMELRAIDILERAYGPDHLAVVSAYINLAYAYTRASRFAEARALYERVLAATEKLHGPDSYEVVIVLNSFSNLLYQIAETGEALRLQLRALQIAETVVGPDHSEVATLLNNIGTYELEAGDLVHARAHFERSLAIIEALANPDHPQLTAALRGLALIANKERRHAEAILLAERIVRLREAGEAIPVHTAEARLILAEALLGAGRDLGRARTLAQDARAGFLASTFDRDRAALADALLAKLP